MENTTIEVTTLTDLELMQAFMKITGEVQTLNAEFAVISTEFNRRKAAEEKAKTPDLKPDPTA